jgi:hypothetical protein
VENKMQIIFDEAVAKQLQNSHTVLELETFDYKGAPRTAYCVVPAEKIPLTDFPKLHNQKELHSEFVKAYNNKDFKLCEDISEHLVGLFGGELDSFYNEILKKITNAK